MGAELALRRLARHAERRRGARAALRAWHGRAEAFYDVRRVERALAALLERAALAFVERERERIAAEHWARSHCRRFLRRAAGGGKAGPRGGGAGGRACAQEA